MAEQLTEPRQAPQQTARAHELTVPLLFSTSEGNGWEDLIVRAYHEPMKYDGWNEPVMPNVALVQLTRGAMRIGQRRADGSWSPIAARSGDLFLTPAGGGGTNISWRSLNDEPMQTLHVLLSAELLARTAREMADREPAGLKLVGRAGFRDPLLMQVGLAAWHELEYPTVGGKLYAQMAAQLLAAHLLRHYASVTLPVKEPAQSLTQRQLNHAIDFIGAYLDQDLSLRALAGEAGFSPYHFARLFRRATGHSPHQFVLRQRIARAQRLLQKGDLPLAQVALESGFANQSHLTRAFRQYLGVTPATYREQYTSRARFCQSAHE